MRVRVEVGIVGVRVAAAGVELVQLVLVEGLDDVPRFIVIEVVELEDDVRPVGDDDLVAMRTPEPSEEPLPTD